MITRYDLFDKLEELCSLKQIEENQYNKMVSTGKLETIYDYGTGFIDVCIKYEYIPNKIDGSHACRIWFGTIDDSNFGSWNFFDTKQEAIELINKACEIFKNITSFPTYRELNIIFEPINIRFLNE